MDYSTYSDQAIWSLIKTQLDQPQYHRYKSLLLQAKIITALTLLLLTVGVGLLGSISVVAGIIVLSIAVILSLSFGLWLLRIKPLPLKAAGLEPSLTQWRVIAWLYGLTLVTLIGLSVLNMVYKDQLIKAVRHDYLVLIRQPANETNSTLGSN